MREGRVFASLLFAAIGCNIAWGIIDAVMYIVNCITVRSGKVRLVKAVRRSPDGQAALALIQDEIEPELQEASYSRGCRSVEPICPETYCPGTARKDHFDERRPLRRMACFWLVFVSCLPAAIPFLIFSQPHFALRVF